MSILCVCVCVWLVSGNHLVQECGRDRTKLCTPCEPNTYADLPLPWFCKSCTQCIGMMSSTFWANQDSSKSLDMIIEILPNSVLHHINITFTAVGTDTKTYVFNVSLLMPLCTDPQIQVKPCSATADTVCGCKPGLRCGNQRCEYCVEECKKGQEPTNESTSLYVVMLLDSS